MKWLILAVPGVVAFATIYVLRKKGWPGHSDGTRDAR